MRMTDAFDKCVWIGIFNNFKILQQLEEEAFSVACMQSILWTRKTAGNEKGRKRSWFIFYSLFFKATDITFIRKLSNHPLLSFETAEIALIQRSASYVTRPEVGSNAGRYLYPREMTFQVHAFKFSHFSHVQLFVTPWTIVCQAPLPMGFSR